MAQPRGAAAGRGNASADDPGDGLYGEEMPKQNGAPIRLVVPWKYGFKSIKSIVRISLVDKMPPTTWNMLQPQEYGFYSNVNPRWTIRAGARPRNAGSGRACSADGRTR